MPQEKLYTVFGMMALRKVPWRQWQINTILTSRSYNAKILQVADKPKDDVDNDDNEESYYKVQLIDENLEGIDQEDCIKVVGGSKIK